MNRYVLHNVDKSTGPDGLGPRILIETAEAISEPLTNIFNQSLETGIVLEDWKWVNVTPIFKKGNKQIPNNYRPISLTSIISKIIERLLNVRITKHLNDQNLITDTQHGFREKCSCRPYKSRRPCIFRLSISLRQSSPRKTRVQRGSAWNTRQLLLMDTKLAHWLHSRRGDSR
ncbi:Reverse transcriptase domain [Trinorchestia longiramus]|nr:Reverse transcriptase domain [Trinorchestia longiramus]